MQVEDRIHEKSMQNLNLRKKSKSSNLNDATCGRTPTFDDRIVGGEETEPFEYPWNVALTLQWGLQFCGGSLINKWVHYISVLKIIDTCLCIKTITSSLTICP